MTAFFFLSFPYLRFDLWTLILASGEDWHTPDTVHLAAMSKLAQQWFSRPMVRFNEYHISCYTGAENLLWDIWRRVSSSCRGGLKLHVILYRWLWKQVLEGHMGCDYISGILMVKNYKTGLPVFVLPSKLFSIYKYNGVCHAKAIVVLK